MFAHDSRCVRLFDIYFVSQYRHPFPGLPKRIKTNRKLGMTCGRTVDAVFDLYFLIYLNYRYKLYADNHSSCALSARDETYVRNFTLSI
jgi:hypothetical protein